MSELIKNTKMFFTSGDSAGCGLYRTIYPSQMLNKPYHLGFPVSAKKGDTVAEQGVQNIVDSDVIFIQRATNEFFLTGIPQLQAMGKKVIYDIDDNLWEIPSSNPAFRPYNATLKKQTKDIIKLCDAVTVSTEPLKQYFLENRFNKNIHVIPNFLHHSLEKKEKVTDRTIIGTWHTNTHIGDWSSKLVFALDKIKDNLPNVDIVFLGWNPMKGDPRRYKYHDFQPAETFMDYLYTLNYDILIAPLTDNIFNRCKSNIKFLEASCCNTATIASSVYPYSNTIVNEETGLLVNDEKKWYDTIERLVIDHGLRKQLTNNAYDFVNQNFTYANNGLLIDGLYTNLLESVL